jgi:hypothetical protein
VAVLKLEALMAPTGELWMGDGWTRRRKGGGVESRDLKGPGLWGLFELVLSLFEKSRHPCSMNSGCHMYLYHGRAHSLRAWSRQRVIKY